MKNFLFFLFLLSSTVMYGQLSSENFDIKIIRGKENFTKIWDDKGSGATKDVSFWRPKNIPQGYYILGDVALNRFEPDQKNPLYTLIVKPKDPTMIQPPKKITTLWRDKGSDAEKDVYIYKLECPQGYVALGMFASKTNDFSDGQRSKCRCFKKTETLKGDWGDLKDPTNANTAEPYWTDSGSGADKDVSVWRTTTLQPINLGQGELGISPNTFFASKHHTNDPSYEGNEPYILRAKFNLKEISIFNQLEGQYQAPKPFYDKDGTLVTNNGLTQEYKVPFFLISDPTYKTQLEQMDKSPVYLIKRSARYKVVIEGDNEKTSLINSITVTKDQGISTEENHSWGWGVAVGASFTAGGKVGIPLVVEGEASVTLSTEFSFNHSWGGSEIKTSSFSAGATLNIPKGCKGAILAETNDYKAFRLEGSKWVEIPNAKFTTNERGSNLTTYFLRDWCRPLKPIEITMSNGEIIYVSPEDQPNVHWGDNKDITALTAVTSDVAAKQDFNGKTNTDAIVTQLGAYGGTAYAAKVCADLVAYGFDDWYLPAAGELNEMYLKLGPNGSGEMNIGIYWSSTESNSNSPWSQNFRDGKQYGEAYYKAAVNMCRCVRRKTR